MRRAAVVEYGTAAGRDPPGVTARDLRRPDRKLFDGAWFAAEARGRGPVTRAARLLTGWALGTWGTSRVEWSAATANVHGIAVARRFGRECEGVLRSALTLDGVRHDVEAWSLVADRR